MKKRLLTMLSMAVILVCLFAISISAATSNEFGAIETIDGIDLTNMNTDTTSRVVIVDGNGEYHTYPAQYVVSNNTKFKYDFTSINNALSASYTKNSIVRIEVPDNITIATSCGDLSQTSNLIEIKFSPDSELTTLEYGCFYANKKLEKLNIPKKVTTISTLIVNNSHLEELIFDDGFSAVLPNSSFSGATGLRKIVFSNQMTSIADKAFDGTLGEELEEFYFGASLKDLGTNNMAWVKQSVKFYIPAEFLSEVDSISMETFSWWNSSACLPTGVIFFTGTKEQAEALNNKSTYDRVFSANSTLVEWDSSKADDEFVPASGWTIVYNYNVCKAFYNNEHAIDESKLTLDFKSYTDTFSEKCACANGCGLETVVNTYEPIFSGVKYSVKENGTALCASYSVNKKSLDLYNEYNSGATLSYGVIASKAPSENEILLTLDNGNVVASNTNAVLVGIDSKYAGFDFVIRGFSEDGSQDNIALVVSAYVTNGTDIYYIGVASANTAPTPITMSEAKNTTSTNSENQ